MKRKILSVTMAALLCLSLAACGEEADKPAKDNQDTSAPEVKDNTNTGDVANKDKPPAVQQLHGRT